MSGSSKRKARRARGRAEKELHNRIRQQHQAEAYDVVRRERVQAQALDKAALTKLADHIEQVIAAGNETPPRVELPRLDVPLLVERVNRAHQQGGKTYEEDNWHKLSPKFRDAHNRLLLARGLPTIPPPKVDNYKPPPPTVRKTLVMDPDALAAARSFLRLPSGVPMLPGEEGFSIGGVKQR